MAVTQVTQENIKQEIKQADKPVVLDVFAEWCGPCKQMEPIFEELSEKMGDTYKFASLNVDEARDIAVEYGVTSVPTFVFIKNDEVQGKETGYMDQEALQEKISEYLGSA